MERAAPSGAARFIWAAASGRRGGRMPAQRAVQSSVGNPDKNEILTAWNEYEKREEQ